jgi:LCP family protein required for cell wall assembly
VTTAPSPRRDRHGVRNAFIGLMVCVSLLGLSAAGGILYLQYHLTHQIHRIDNVFEGLPEAKRPQVPTHGTARKAVNILVMGTDRRSEVATTGRDAGAPEWVPGEQRTDTLMLVHIDGDRRGASVISIPRDSWVTVPGHGYAKINAAFSYAGPSLAVQTVEELTGVRIDHLAVVDWAGFRDLTDAVGGVTVDVPRTVVDSAHGVTWTAGPHTLDGEQALMYVRQRYGLPRGDLDRVRRQQYFLRLLMEDSLHQDMRKNPKMVYDFLDTVTQHLSVDSDWSIGSMRSLVISLRNLQTHNIDYLTAPVWGLGDEDGQSVVYLDVTRGESMWAAVREDRVAGWVARHPGAEIPDSVS